MQAIQTVEVAAEGDAEGSVIWLHGLGADGHDFEPVVKEMQLSGVLNLRFVFPHAPVRPVTVNNGMNMRAWYDILSLDRVGPPDEAGIRQSSEIVEQLIATERGRGIPDDRILLAGFSQGGAIALHCGLRQSKRLAGLMALSTYLPMHRHFSTEVAENNDSQDRSVPIFMAHGSADPVLPVDLGLKSRDMLSSAGYSVQWHEYSMGHAVCAEEIVDIRKWLLSVYARAS